jgi:hypothetical protein
VESTAALVPGNAPALISASYNSPVDASGSALAPTAAVCVTGATETNGSTVAATVAAAWSGTTSSVASFDHDFGGGGDDYWAVSTFPSTQSADLSVVLRGPPLALHAQRGDGILALRVTGRVTRSRSPGSQLPLDPERQVVKQANRSKQSHPPRSDVTNPTPVETAAMPATEVNEDGRCRTNAAGQSAMWVKAAATTGDAARTVLTQVRTRNNLCFETQYVN